MYFVYEFFGDFAIPIICDQIGKTLGMGFFLKIAFDLWLSPTIELTRVQIPDRLCASLRTYSALFAIAQ